MSREGKSALAKLADAASEGSSVAHTPAAPEGEAALADLLGFEAELDQFAGQTVAPPRRGPGRPAGSANRTTLQLHKYLMARGYRDPAEFLASIVSADTRALASALRRDDGPPTFDQAEAAFKLQVRAAESLMPYFHQRLPQAVTVTNPNARPVILIQDSNVGVVVGRPDGVMSIHDDEVQQDQALSERMIEGSHGGGSHDHN